LYGVTMVHISDSHIFVIADTNLILPTLTECLHALGWMKAMPVVMCLESTTPHS